MLEVYLIAHIECAISQNIARHRVKSHACTVQVQKTPSGSRSVNVKATSLQITRSWERNAFNAEPLNAKLLRD